MACSSHLAAVFPGASQLPTTCFRPGLSGGPSQADHVFRRLVCSISSSNIMPYIPSLAALASSRSRLTSPHLACSPVITTASLERYIHCDSSTCLQQGPLVRQSKGNSRSQREAYLENQFLGVTKQENHQQLKEAHGEHLHGNRNLNNNNSNLWCQHPPKKMAGFPGRRGGKKVRLSEEESGRPVPREGCLANLRRRGAVVNQLQGVLLRM